MKLGIMKMIRRIGLIGIRLMRIRLRRILLPCFLPPLSSPAMSFGVAFKIEIDLVFVNVFIDLDFKKVRNIRNKVVKNWVSNVKGEIRLEGSSLGTGGNVPDWIVVKGERSCCFTRF